MARMTSQEFAAFQARMKAKLHYPVESSKPDVQGSDSKVQTESDLHEQILAECRRRGWIPLHGSMAHRTRRTVGEPDFVILGETSNAIRDDNGDEVLQETKPHIWLVECKSAHGKLSMAQQGMIRHAAKLSHTIHVVRSFEEFLKIIKG